ncbi:MAG: tetratricopeptide repeat protein [Bdellovibrionota bacterium]
MKLLLPACAILLLPIFACSAAPSKNAESTHGARLLKAREAIARHDEETAKIEIKAFIKEEPNNPAPFLMLGELTKKEADVAKDEKVKLNSYLLAAASYEKAVSLDPKNPLPYFEMGDICLSTDDPVRAEDYLNKTLELSPDYPGAKARLKKAQAAITKKWMK